MGTILPDRSVPDRSTPEYSIPEIISGTTTLPPTTSELSTLLSSTSAPSTPEELWSMAHLLRPNWSSGVEITTAWNTVISVSKSGAEERRCSIGRPKRTMSFTWLALDAGSLEKLQSQLVRMAMSRFPMPVWTDFVTVSSTATGTTLTCGERPVNATGWTAVSAARWFSRRFFAGQRLAITKMLAGKAEFQSVRYVTSTTFITSGPNYAGWNLSASDAHVIGERVFPVMECLPVFTPSVQMNSNRVGSIRITVEEDPGPNALPPFQIPGELPSEVGSYEGLPILNSRSNWVSVTVGFSQLGSLTSIGLDVLISRISRPAASGSISFGCVRREGAIIVRKMFDYAAGRLNPFFLPLPSDSSPFYGVINNHSIVLSYTGTTLDAQMNKTFVFIRLRNGTVYIRRITSTSVSGSQITINWSSGEDITGLSGMAIHSAGWAIKARFDSDELVETWTSDEIMTTSINFVELTEERVVESKTLASPVIGGEPNAWELCNGDGNFIATWYDDRVEPMPIFVEWVPPWPEQGTVPGIRYVPILNFPSFIVATPTGDNPYRFTLLESPNCFFCKPGILRSNGKFNIPTGAVIDIVKVHCEVSASPGSDEFNANQANWYAYLFVDTGTSNPSTALTFRFTEDDTASDATYLPKNYAGDSYGWPVENTKVYETTHYKCATAGRYGPDPARSNSGSFAWSKFTADNISERNGARFGMLLWATNLNDIEGAWVEIKVWIEVTYIYGGNTFTQRVGK